MKIYIILGVVMLMFEEVVIEEQLTGGGPLWGRLGDRDAGNRPYASHVVQPTKEGNKCKQSQNGSENYVIAKKKEEKKLNVKNRT